MNKLIEKMFENRGFTPEFIREIENPAHDTLMDIDVLCARLHRIHMQNLHIVVYSDFDMDGIMSGTEGFAGFAELGFRVSLFIPTPSEGYGFKPKDVDKLIATYPDVNAIITCDVGISEQEGIQYAKDRGIEVLVTDHHIQKAPSNADCTVNPMRLDEVYSHPAICGAYVLYQVLQHYAATYCDLFMQDQIKRLCVFAGIGTISDCMPLLYENRKLVRDAIMVTKLIYADGEEFVVNNIVGCDIYRRAFLGLHMVCRVMADMGKLRSADDITEDLFAFYIAPMFNSVKRMDGDMTKTFGVFFGATPYEDAEYLFMLNNQRKTLKEQYFKEIFETDQPYAPYIYFSDAPTGILGLLAQSLMELSGLPTLVLRKDKHYHGSGRSPKWYLYFDKVFAAGFYVAGHNPAFVMGLTDKREIKSLYAFLHKDVTDVYQSLNLQDVVYKPDFVIAHDGTGDTVIDILLFSDYLKELEKLHPFGDSFAYPDVLLKFYPTDGPWKVMGNMKQHIKIRLQHGFEVLLWNSSNELHRKDKDEPCYVRGKIGVIEFRGVRTVNFMGSFVDLDEKGDIV